MQHLFFWFLSMLFSVNLIQEKQLTPHIYYYSHQENAFIAERANGTDRREFGSDTISSIPVKIHGPGWSPDGEWFAFSADINNHPSGHVIRPDSANRVGLVERLARTGPMHWSPDSKLLFVAGNIDSCENYCSNLTYWLIDVEDNVLLAWLDFRRGLRSPGETTIEWSVDNEQITFYEIEEVLSATAFSSYYEITLATNGVVVKQPISREEWNIVFVPVGEPLPNVEELQLVSPSGRYTISGAEQLTDNQTASAIDLPTSDFGYEQDSRLIEARWDASEEWVLLGYNIWSSSGVDGVSIVRVDGSGYRELTTCGFAPACVGWLPENVDVMQIPLLEGE